MDRKCYHVEVSKLKVTIVPPQGLLDSIAKRGVLTPIWIDQDFNVMDGGARVACCKMLDILTIPAIQITMTKEQREMNWIMKPVKYHMTTPEQYRRNAIHVFKDATVAEAVNRLDISFARFLGHLWRPVNGTQVE